jgi:hypothetical protein
MDPFSTSGSRKNVLEKVAKYEFMKMGKLIIWSANRCLNRMSLLARFWRDQTRGGDEFFPGWGNQLPNSLIYLFTIVYFFFSFFFGSFFLHVTNSVRSLCIFWSCAGKNTVFWVVIDLSDGRVAAVWPICTRGGDRWRRTVVRFRLPCK